MAVTEELRLVIRGDIRDIRQDFRTVERDGARSARRIGDGFEATGQRIRASFSALRTGVFAVGAAATAMGVLGQRSLAVAENIQDLSDRADVSAEFLQELRFVTNQSGASARDFDDAISRLNRRFGLFIQNLRTGQGEAGPAAAAFRSLGLETRIASGKIQNSEQVFYAAVEALQDVESAAQRSALASQLFGEDSGPRLVGLLDRGADGIRNLASEARALGLVMTNDMVRKGAEASDQLEILGNVLRLNVVSAIVNVAPEIQRMAESFTRAVPGMIELATRLGDQMARAFGLGSGDPTTVSAAQRRLTEIGRLAGEFDVESGGPGRKQTDLINLIGREDVAAINRQVFDEGLGFLIGDILRGGTQAYERQAELIIERLREEAERIREIKRELELGEDGEPTNTIPRSTTENLKAASREVTKDLSEKFGKAIPKAIQDQRDQIAQTFGNSMSRGMMAALNGNFRQFLSQVFMNAASRGFSDAFSGLFKKGTAGGGFLGAGLNAVASFFGAGKYASGGPASGLSLVGEQGPELVNLGGMANVMTAAMTRRVMGGGSPEITVIDQSRGVQVSANYVTPDQVRLMIEERAPQAVAGQFENPNSPVSRSLTQGFGVRPSRGNV
jgi:hypothetical protein